MERPDARELLQQASHCNTVEELRRVMEGFGLWLNDTAIVSTFEALRRRRAACSGKSGTLGDRELAQVAGGVGSLADDQLDDETLLAMLERMLYVV